MPGGTKSIARRQSAEDGQQAAGKQQGAPRGDLLAEIHDPKIDAFAAQSGGQLVGIGYVRDHGSGYYPYGAGEDAPYHVPDNKREGVACAERPAIADQ